MTFKRITLVFLGLITFLLTGFSQNVSLNSQAALDSFDPNTTTIAGDLTIESTDLSDPITDLSNLTNLNSIAGDLYILNNQSLLTLDGFSNFVSFAGHIVIENNDALPDITGFSNLADIYVLEINNNSALEDISGFQALVTINRIEINNNDDLLNLDLFENLTAIGGALRINHNASIPNLNSLSNITSIGGTTRIGYNNIITNLDGLSNLESIGEFIFIGGNQVLENIDGLSNLTYLGKGMDVKDNPFLENLDGFSGLTKIGKYAKIVNNASLLNLDGFSNIDSIGGNFEVSNNPVLGECCGIQDLLSLAGGVVGSVSLSGNPFACSSETEVIEKDCNQQVFVDASALGNNDGTSWTDAFTDLQAALMIGTEVTIHIAEGTYYPTTTSIRGKSFDIQGSNMLLGGYPTGGGNRESAVYETILSGNIDGNAGSIAGDSYHVVTIKNAYDIILDGIIIRDGNADDAATFARSRGGGIYMVNASLSLNKVELKWNRAIYGAGIFASLSTAVNINESILKKNRADYGAAIYHSNETNMYINHSQIINNTANNRCAIEVNNSLYTKIENSIIANNIAASANAISFVATNRNQSCDIINTTILGGSKDRSLITVLVGFGDQMDLQISNSIIAHQNLAFTKNMIAFNNGVLNFNHDNCYFQGGAIIGTGTNTLFSDTAGDLMLNSDYSVNECSPVVDAGDDALSVGTTDIAANPRLYNTVDLGAYEAQVSCPMFRELSSPISKQEITISPNPASTSIQIKTVSDSNHRLVVYDMLSRRVYDTIMQQEQNINIQEWAIGTYMFIIYNDKGKMIDQQKILKVK